MTRWMMTMLMLGALVACAGEQTETIIVNDQDTPSSPADTGTPVDSSTVTPDTTVMEDTSGPTPNDPANCMFSESVQNPGGKLHSEPCENDSECLYGLCHSSPTVANFKFCTKNPYCPGASCSEDDGDGKTSKSQIFNNSSHPDEIVKSICTQTCTTVGECPSGYTGCAVVTGVAKVCVVE